MSNFHQDDGSRSKSSCDFVNRVDTKICIDRKRLGIGDWQGERAPKRKNRYLTILDLNQSLAGRSR